MRTPSRFLVALSAGLLFVTTAVFGEMVNKISVITPDEKPYSSDVVKANIFTASGKAFNQQALAEDIERLYKSGYFQFVDAQVKDVAGGKHVVFIVQPRPRIRTIAFEGNSRFKDKKLLKKIDLAVGDLFAGTEAAAATRTILEMYRKKGYHETQVKLIENDDLASRTVDLVWQITEAPRYKVKKVVFEGNTVFSARQLRKQMLTKSTIFSRILPVGFYNEQKFDVDRRALRAMYADEGYLDARFSMTESVGDKEKWVVLTITIEEGQPYTVRDVSLNGNELFSGEELKPLLKLTAGETYRDSVKDADVNRLRDKYRPLGYMNMNVRVDLDKDARDHTVGVTYVIFEGNAITVRDIRIQGNVDTRDKVIRRELRIQPGDLADMNKIESSKRVLQNLGYFEDVTISPRSVPGSDDLTDLEVSVVEGPTGSFTFGGGFSDSDGFILSADVTKSNFDLKRFLTNWPPRAGGGGQRIKLSLQAGSDQNNFLLSFVEPWFMDKRLRLETSAFHKTRDYDDYEQMGTGGEVSLTRSLNRLWRQSFGLRVQHVEISDVDTYEEDFYGNDFTIPNEQLKDDEGKYWSNSVIFGLRRDSRNAFYNPTRGSRLNLSLRLAPEVLGSYSDVYELNVTGTKYIPLTRTNTLRIHGQVATVDNAGGDDVVVFDRFFTGGATSIRGFKWRDVGPVDYNEDPVGGKSLFVGSVEFIHVFRTISENLRGSLFCDFGNVWEDAYEYDGSVNASVGVGVEINLPMGRGRIPIRLDYGYPVQTDQDHLDGEDGRLHFNFGYHY